jgi:hypothetical protein
MGGDQVKAIPYALDSGRFENGWALGFWDEPIIEVRKFRPGKRCAKCGREFSDGDVVTGKRKPVHHDPSCGEAKGSI